MAFTIQDSGICLNAEDLILKLRNLVLTAGYTVNDYSDNIISGTTRGKKLHISKNGKFYNFCGVSNISPVPSSGTDTEYLTYSLQSINANISTNYSNTLNWYSQENSSGDSSIRTAQVSSNANYWIFINDLSIVIVCKFNSINYSIMNIGELNCYSATDSLIQVTASSNTYNSYNSTDSILRNRTPFASENFINHSTQIYNGVNINANRLYENHYSYGNTYYPLFLRASESLSLIPRSDNIFNGTSILHPIEYFEENSGIYNPIASVENIFIVNMLNHNPENTFNVGENSFIVFPFNRKRSPQVYNSDGFGLGIAIQTSGV